MVSKPLSASAEGGFKNDLMKRKSDGMIKIYGMKSCPDCVAVDKQVESDSRYQVINTGEHVSLLKEFLYLRDNNPVFNEARKKGCAGVPCLVLEDGAMTLNPEEAGLRSGKLEPTSCRIDGSGC